ncbi:MAG: hypothetical protein M1823_005481 [Watsoniomyces obsoletus]|nr:MAG: hypothetical protein M1823_005481 [Watsoniomyces obsoletus]
MPVLRNLVCPGCCRPQSRLIIRRASPFVRPGPFIHLRSLQTQRFQSFVPPPPDSLPRPAPPRTYARTRRWTRRLLYLVAGIGGGYLFDRFLLASSIVRSLRTFSLGIIVAADYKINFREQPLLADSIPAVHARNAERLFDLLRTNGGLYLKIGQAIAMQSAILPPEFQKMFAKMFDDAPQNDWKDVQRVIEEDFGKSVEEVFGVSFDGDSSKGVMERTARASASVAQVHWARLQDGREVAIKVQKREIALQVGWDLWAFKVVSYIYSYIFDLPLYTLVPFVSERLFLETDFEYEADNAERMAGLVASESRLNGRVYIPKVYRELSSKRVMTAEWIEGVRLWDKETLTAPWRGGRRQGSPGCRGAPLDPVTTPSMKPTVSPSLDPPTNQPSSILDPTKEKIKPERTFWKGPNGRGGLGVSLQEVMTIMVDLFSAQMFLWGWIHCDPHPGNIFIRRLPSGKPELVLIDHGLYIHLEPAFRHQYALFWKSLLTFDNTTLKEIVRSWGVNNVDIFASAALMRPYSSRGKDHPDSLFSTRHHSRSTTSNNNNNNEENRPLTKQEQSQRHYELQQKMRSALREILGDDKKWPRELLFIGRNLRIVQGNNQFLGSPVNRIKITGIWASRALVESPDLSYSQKIANLGRHLIFRAVLFSTDVVFWVTRLRQWLGRGGGMEDEMEMQLRGIAKENFGVELNHGVFEG